MVLNHFRQIFLIVSGLLIAGYKFSRFGVESPEYTVVKNDGDFEIRNYPEMVIVTTPMADPRPDEGTSFMRLFRYISGSNEAEEKIAMTTPVLTTEEDGERYMSFIVPQNVAAEGAPASMSDLVNVQSMSGGKYAVYRFDGSWNMDTFEMAKVRLAEWLASQNLTPIGEPVIANYDPPYTPSFLKRNEIMVPLKSGNDS